MTVKLSIKDLLLKLESTSDKRYSVAQISRQVKLSRRITNDLFFGSPEQIRMSTLEKLLDFFHREGMPIGVGDLFTVTDSPDD